MEEDIKLSFAQLAGSKATTNEPHIDDIEEVDFYNGSDIENNFKEMLAEMKETEVMLVGSVVTQMAEM